MKALIQFGLKHGRKVIILVAAIVHVAVILAFTVKMGPDAYDATESADIFKMADIEENPAPPSKAKEALPAEETVTVHVQAATAGDVVETDKVVVETTAAVEEVVYLPQYKISRIPVIPGEQILSRIKYPELAARQGIEGIVYLELYIDKKGVIRKIVVLKDPGFGFADAAVKAVEGSVCQPAAANGEAVAVIFRYPVRFAIKK